MEANQCLKPPSFGQGGTITVASQSITCDNKQNWHGPMALGGFGACGSLRLFTWCFFLFYLVLLSVYTAGLTGFPDYQSWRILSVIYKALQSNPNQTSRLFFFFSNRNLNKNRPVAHVVRGTLQWWYEYWCLVVTTPEHRLGKSSLNAYRGVTLYCFIRIRKKEIHVI